MEIKQTVDGNEAVLALSGWLDTKTSPELGKALDGLGEEITKLVLDFQNLEYISSAGLRQIIVAHKMMEKKEGLVIRNVCAEVMDVLQMTGFDKRLSIE